MKVLYKMTESELQTIANNPNTFGSMLARKALNDRCSKSQIDEGCANIEVPYKFDENDRNQYRNELYSVVWED